MASPCVYCGTRSGDTDDHVPPKALFPKPRPSDLITVPCCEECRQEQGRDDEYLKRVIVIRRDLAKHPAASKLLPSVHRSMANPKQRGFNLALVGALRNVDVKTRAGIILGQAPGYNVDLDRLSRVMHRVTLALYYHEIGHRLPAQHDCRVYPLDGLEPSDLAEGSGLRQVVDYARAGNHRVWGQEVFARWFNGAGGAEDATGWVFVLYGKVAFVAFTARRLAEDAV